MCFLQLVGDEKGERERETDAETETEIECMFWGYYHLVTLWRYPGVKEI